MRLLQSNLANLARTIGNVFLPTIAKILPYINGFVIALQRAVNWVMKILNIDLSDLGSTGGSSNFDMSYVADDAENTADGLDKAEENAKKLKRTILGFDQLNILNGDDGKEDEMDSAEITAGLEGALDDILNEYQKVWDEAFAGMENTAQQIADNIQAAFSGIFDTFSQAWAEVGQPVVEAFEFMLENVKGVLVDIGKTFHDIFTSDTGVELIKSILELFRSIFTVIGTIAQAFRTAWNDGGGKALVEALFTMFTDINNLLTAIGDSFSRVFSNGTGAEIISNILGIFTDIFTIIGNIAEGIRKAWEEGGLGDSIWQGILNIINTILETIHNITTATVEWSEKLDFTPLLESIDNLLKALEPLTENIGKGLEWFWKNVLLPIAGWTIEEAVPTFLNMLAAAIKVLNEVIEALKPLAQWLWDEFLKPLGEWTGDLIIAAMEKITDKLNELADWISNNQEKVQQMAVTIGLLFAAFETGKVITNIVNIIAKMGGLVGILSELGGMVTTVINPWTIAIAGITAVVVDLWKTSETFRDSVKDAFDKVKDSLTDAFNKIKEAVSPLIDSIKDLATSFIDFYKNSPLKAITSYFGTLASTIGGTILSTAIDVISTAFAGLLKTLTGAADILGGVLDVLTGIFTLDFDKAKEGIGKIWDGFKEIVEGAYDRSIGIGIDIVKGIYQGIVDYIKDMGSWLQEHVVDPFVGWFKKLFGIHSPSTVMAEQGGFIIEGLLKGLKDTINSVLDWFGKIPGWIKEKLGDAKEWLVNKGKNAIQGLKDGWEAVKESKIGKAAEALSGYLKEKAGDAKEWIKEKGSQAIEGLKNGWEAVKESKFGQIASKIGSYVSEKAGNAKTWIEQKGKDAIDGLKNGWETVKESNFLSKVSKIKDEVFTKIGDIKDKVTSKGKDVIDGIHDGLTSNWSKLSNWFGNLGNKIKNALPTDLYSQFTKVGGNIIGGIKKGITGAANTVKKAVNKVTGGIVYDFEEDLDINSPSKVMEQEGEYVVAGLVKGMEGDEDTLNKWSENVSEHMKENIGDTEEWLIEKGEGVVNGFLSGIETKWEELENWIDETIGNTIETLGEKGTELVETFSTSVSEKWEEFSEWCNSSFLNAQDSFSGFLSEILKILENSLNEMLETGEKKTNSFNETFLNKFNELLSEAPTLYNIGQTLISSFIDGFQSIEVPTPNINSSGGIGFSEIEINDVPDLLKDFSNVQIGDLGGKDFLSSKEIFANSHNIIESTNAQNSMSEMHGAIKQAITEGMSQSMMMNQSNLNNQPPINFTLKLENDEAIARAAIRGQQKLDYRYNPTPRYGY